MVNKKDVEINPYVVLSLERIALAEYNIAESLKELVKIVQADYDHTKKETQDRIKKEFPNIN